MYFLYHPRFFATFLFTFICRDFENEQEFMNHVRSIPNGSVFTTAVENLKPWYSHAIANWMISKMKKFDDTTPLVIYEIGGGSGTNAKCIIEYLQKKHPRLFKSLEYNIIDLSKPLVELQKKHLML
eukprot:Phypoly_transcript_30208.p1 GENE.Phypoly_transcript_30208~~Phypoly_transcript_30208.p1  ORF type:complete len:126 (+),score=5.11 Phypoly_transcript_30208:27-404(+)